MSLAAAIAEMYESIGGSIFVAEGANLHFFFLIARPIKALWCVG